MKWGSDGRDRDQRNQAKKFFNRKVLKAKFTVWNMYSSERTFAKFECY